MPYRRAPQLTGFLVAFALVSAPLWGANVDVTVGGSGTIFSPATVDVHVGDTVTWHNAGGFHNVAADNGSFSNAQSSSAWTFSHTYTSAGTFGYHCQVHGGPGSGMFGTVHVDVSAPTPQPGELKFSQASFTAGEAVGQATITVQRTNGSDGAVSVAFNATAGTASAGADFTPASGTLNWADGDGGSKTFKVTIANDTIQEPSETILLALASPTGGATLDDSAKTATLTIQDNDSAPTGPLTAPTNLTATALTTTEIGLSWTDNAGSETGTSIERRSPGGAYEVIGTVAANVTTFTAGSLSAARLYFFRVRATGAGGAFSAYSNEASEATNGVTGVCVTSPTNLCVNNGRFKVEVDWRTASDSSHGQAVPLPSAPDSGLFYFFNPSNVEMLIKVLNACVPEFGNHFWVFYAATTNVEFTTTVTDTQSGRVKVYFNPLNQTAAPVQDVNAFSTCP
ncbi:MAG: hypothetical protein QOF89_3148 [Acidobacteriota bacterium]|nr:hypothetical protein [Acidobacteriota bacterium]